MTSNYERSWDRADLARMLPDLPTSQRDEIFEGLRAGATPPDAEVIQRMLVSGDVGALRDVLRRIADDDLPPTSSA